MRIISGIAKGRKLYAPTGIKTRPTADRVKEAIFSIIYDELENAQVLDLFAGSGALGIEALSRGAKSAVFIDDQNQAIEAIKKNLELANFISKSVVISINVFQYIESAKNTNKLFDLIFADPPYKIDDDLLFSLVNQALGLLKTGGLFILEHFKDKTFKAFEKNIIKAKNYSSCAVTIFKN